MLRFVGDHHDCVLIRAALYEAGYDSRLVRLDDARDGGGLTAVYETAAPLDDVERAVEARDAKRVADQVPGSRVLVEQ